MVIIQPNSLMKNKFHLANWLLNHYLFAIIMVYRLGTGTLRRKHPAHRTIAPTSPPHLCLPNSFLRGPLPLATVCVYASPPLLSVPTRKCLHRLQRRPRSCGDRPAPPRTRRCSQRLCRRAAHRRGQRPPPVRTELTDQSQLGGSMSVSGSWRPLDEQWWVH